MTHTTRYDSLAALLMIVKTSNIDIILIESFFERTELRRMASNFDWRIELLPEMSTRN